MQVIPVLDLLDGHAVRAVRGERSRYRPVQSSLCATSDPVEVARALVAATGSNVLYVADLGAILSRGDHADVLGALSNALGRDAFLWLDAGFADCASMRAFVRRVLDRSRAHAHAHATIVPVFGTESLRHVGALAEAAACGFDPVLSLDRLHGDALGVLHDDASWWPARVIVMTLDRVGAFDGPDLQALSAVLAVAGEREVIGAGGIRSRDDLWAAERAGAAAWLTASALHDLRISFDAQ
jgi:phosphoribosylformimino-5-aminoimidazole carboxamide ribotide isomerase